MRILLVAHQYWPTPGSATQVLTALVTELRGRGHEVDVLTCSPPSGIKPEPVGPRGERIHYAAGPEKGGVGPGRALRLAAFAAGVLRVGRRIKADLVISDPPPTAGTSASLLARQKKVPFVYYMADSWVGASEDMSGFAGRLRKVIRALEAHVVTGADQVVAATRGMARIAGNLGATRVTVVENGADISTYSPDGPSWQAPGPRPFFLYAGNAGAVHGATVFSEAANILWRAGLDFDLVFMGYGTDFDDVAHLADRPERVHRVEPQPVDVVASAYRGAAGALSSLRPNPKYADARPIKTLTGLACGCPAVYSGEGDFAAVIQREGLGFATQWDVEATADSMRKALELSERPEEATALRAHCAEYAREHFDDRKAASRVVDIVEQAAEGAR